MDEANKLIINYLWELGLGIYLVLVLAYYFIFRFVKKYHNLSFRETVHHPINVFSCLIFIVIALTIAMYNTISYKLLDDKLPEAKLVVTVTSFSEIGRAVRGEGEAIAHRIKESLENKIKIDNIPLKINLVENVIEGKDEETRQKEALEIGKSRKGLAHLVVWGDVRKDEGELWMKARITRAHKLGSTELEERKLGSYITKLEPMRLELKKRLSIDVTNLIMLISGIAWLDMGKLDYAISLLTLVNTPEAALYKGLSHSYRALSKKNPVLDYKMAIKDFESILGSPPWTLHKNSLASFAFGNIGNVFRQLGIISEGNDSRKYLLKSMDAYHRMTDVYTQNESPKIWAMTQSNIGLSLLELGRRTKSEEESKKTLNRAAEAFEKALEVFTPTDSPLDWAATQGNLGLLLGEIAIRTKGEEESKKALNRAVETFEKALEVFTPTEYPQDWTMTQIYIGLLLGEIGILSEGEEAIGYFDRVIKSYDLLLTVLTKEYSPYQYNMVTNSKAMAIQYKEEMESQQE